MLGTIIACVLAILLGLWLVFSTLGIIIQLVGVALLIAGVVYLIRALSARSGTGI